LDGECAAIRSWDPKPATRVNQFDARISSPIYLDRAPLRYVVGQDIKNAYGYRPKERFKTDIFFHMGGLDLYPIQ
jgi:hypothetical protein